MYMQKICATFLLGLLVYMPFGYSQPAVVETHTNIESTAFAGQVSVIGAPDVGLVRVSARLEVSRATCSAGVSVEAPLVQQTANLEALLICDSLAFGHVAETAVLPVVTSPANSAGLAVMSPVREFVGPAMTPWHPLVQAVALVFPIEPAILHKSFFDRLQAVPVLLVTHSPNYQNAKTLAELGFMLC